MIGNLKLAHPIAPSRPRAYLHFENVSDLVNTLERKTCLGIVIANSGLGEEK